MNLTLQLPQIPLFDVGEGRPIILLHGLFGNLSNWGQVAFEFTATNRVIIPRLPLYSTPLTAERLDALVDYLENFIDRLGLEDVILMGNSLGGHIALLYAWRRPENVHKLVLAGSSGLTENAFGGTFPRVKDYAYIRQRVEDTFYKREVVTKQLVDEVYETVQSRSNTLSIIGLARAAQRHNVADMLREVATPTLLLWGRQDTVTPPEVALEFHHLLPHSKIVFLDQCGHVPMMEQPKLFNQHVRDFWNDKAINYAALAIPAFFLFLGLEYAAAARKHKLHVFKFDSSVANISIGIAERLLNLFLTASFYGVFSFVYTRYAWWHISNTWVVWVVLILATDLVWYWYHRLGHEVNLFWAAHIVHHHSEEFNYSVSARITTLQALVRNCFWCILPLAGFHPSMVMTILVVHGTYSFFTHTQLITKLGWLEHIFITPSHHRVHHASNEKYLNKNYGDLFVFWDKLFGTFQREEEAPRYGLTHPLKSYSFIWQHFHYFLELGYAVLHANGLWQRLRIVFGRPELLDQNIRPMLERKFIQERSAAPASKPFRSYLVAQLAAALTVLFLLTLFYQRVGDFEKITASLLILITLVNCGALLEQRRWIYYLEHLRILILINYVCYQMDTPEVFGLALLVSLAMLWPMQRRYLKWVYGAP